MPIATDWSIEASKLLPIEDCVECTIQEGMPHLHDLLANFPISFRLLLPNWRALSKKLR